MTNKGIDYFRWLLESQNKSNSFIFKEVPVSQKTQEVSYSVIEFIAQTKKKKNHVLSEKLITPQHTYELRKMLTREIEKVPYYTEYKLSY